MYNNSLSFRRYDIAINKNQTIYLYKSYVEKQ